MRKPHTRRLLGSVVVATFLHVALLFVVLQLETRVYPASPDPTPILVFEPPSPAPLPEVEEEPEPEVVEPEPVPEPEPAAEPDEVPRDEVPPAEPLPASDEPRPDEPLPAPTEPAPPAPPAPTLEAGSDSPVRLEPAPSLMGRVMGQGSDPFGLKLNELERGLSYRADGPMSDERRAAVTAKRMLEDDLAEDAVEAGLADDYFRELRHRVDTAWRPAKKQLNDGGGHVDQIGMMKDFGSSPAAWGEVWEIYLDVAQQYARGERPRVDKKRIGKIRELFRSRQGNFRFHAITEVVITQAADGQVLTIEMPLSSGHPGFDDGIRDAIMTATEVMPDKPPPRLTHGRPFRSKWRMRATWTMVPPTAFLTGNSWDIGPKGVEVDVPFQIKLKKRVLLQWFDNRDHSIRDRR
jgi:hypothetical protein